MEKKMENNMVTGAAKGFGDEYQYFGPRFLIELCAIGYPK